MTAAPGWPGNPGQAESDARPALVAVDGIQVCHKTTRTAQASSRMDAGMRQRMELEEKAAIPQPRPACRPPDG